MLLACYISCILLIKNADTLQKLEQNGRQIKTLSDYKKRHEKVIEGLQVYPLSVSENCMVPIGKRALMKGKLTHTNEILVSLGADYFAKYSAPQAISLCKRRIASMNIIQIFFLIILDRNITSVVYFCQSEADKMLKSLEEERNLYEMRQILPLEHDVFGDGDRKDLLEHWEEDKLNEWRSKEYLYIFL